MAKRIFGASATQSTEPRRAAPVVESKSVPKKISEPTRPDEVIAKKSKVPIIITVAASVVFLSTASLFFYKNVYDGGYGNTDPVDAAKGYVTAMLARSNDVNDYLPADVRKASMLSSETAWINKQPYRDIENLSVDITDASSGDYRSNVGALEAGFSTVYGKDMTVDDAKVVHMQAHVTGDNYDSNLEFDVVTIKKGFKWYVYTGDTRSLSDVDTVPDLILPETTTEEKVVTSTEAPVPATKPYAEASSDVMSGKLKLNGTDVTLPMQLSSLQSVFKLNDDMIDPTYRMIGKESVLSNLPVVFTDNKYNSLCLTVDVANINDEDTDVALGAVVGMVVYKSPNGGTPDLVLPGNVVIGTSYSDIAALYGSELKPAKISDDYSKVGAIEKVYKMSLGLAGNNIYFGFGGDDKLVAVKWTYTDLNDHISYE